MSDLETSVGEQCGGKSETSATHATCKGGTYCQYFSSSYSECVETKVRSLASLPSRKRPLCRLS
jgi:hypothetical protein